MLQTPPFLDPSQDPFDIIEALNAEAEHQQREAWELAQHEKRRLAPYVPPRKWMTRELLDAYYRALLGDEAADRLVVRGRFVDGWKHSGWETVSRLNGRWHLHPKGRHVANLGLAGVQEVAMVYGPRARTFVLDLDEHTREVGSAWERLERVKALLGCGLLAFKTPRGMHALGRLERDERSEEVREVLLARLAPLGPRPGFIEVFPAETGIRMPGSRGSNLVDEMTGWIVCGRGKGRINRGKQLQFVVKRLGELEPLDTSKRTKMVATTSPKPTKPKLLKHRITLYGQGSPTTPAAARPTADHADLSERLYGVDFDKRSEILWNEGIPCEGIRHQAITNLVWWLTTRNPEYSPEDVGNEIVGWWNETMGGKSSTAKKDFHAAGRRLKREAVRFARAIQSGRYGDRGCGNSKHKRKQFLTRAERRFLEHRVRRLIEKMWRDEVTAACEYVYSRARGGQLVHVHSEVWISFCKVYGRKRYKALRDKVRAVLRMGKVGGYKPGAYSQGWVCAPLAPARTVPGVRVRHAVVKASSWRAVVVFEKTDRARWVLTGKPPSLWAQEWEVPEVACRPRRSDFEPRGERDATLERLRRDGVHSVPVVQAAPHDAARSTGSAVGFLLRQRDDRRASLWARIVGGRGGVLAVLPHDDELRDR